jgi:hypothetical protein
MASAPAHVVTVSSGAQGMGKIAFDDLQGELVVGYSAAVWLLAISIAR